MDGVQQRIVRRSASKKRILYNLKLLHNVGMERWKELNTGLPVKWREIVLEINAKKVKSCTHPKEAQRIKAVETIVNCETTVIVCGLCILKRTRHVVPVPGGRHRG